MSGGIIHLFFFENNEEATVTVTKDIDNIRFYQNKATCHTTTHAEIFEIYVQSSEIEQNSSKVVMRIGLLGSAI